METEQFRCWTPRAGPLPGRADGSLHRGADQVVEGGRGPLTCPPSAPSITRTISTACPIGIGVARRRRAADPSPALDEGRVESGSNCFGSARPGVQRARISDVTCDGGGGPSSSRSARSGRILSGSARAPRTTPRPGGSPAGHCQTDRTGAPRTTTDRRREPLQCLFPSPCGSRTRACDSGNSACTFARFRRDTGRCVRADPPSFLFGLVQNERTLGLQPPGRSERLLPPLLERREERGSRAALRGRA